MIDETQFTVQYNITLQLTRKKIQYIYYYFPDNTSIPTSMTFQQSNLSTDLTNANENSNAIANQLPFGTSSDSESPTEPVSQQTVAMLRARVVPNKL